MHGHQQPPPEIASAASQQIPADEGVVVLTGSATLTSLNHPNSRVLPGRTVWLFGKNVTGTNITLTHTAASSATAGQMVFSGGANVTLDRGKIVSLTQMSDGIWYQS